MPTQTAPALSQGLLLIGFDSEVVGVQIQNRKVLFSLELTFPFRSLLLVRESEWLVLHECGVQAISATGETRWAFSRDIFEQAEIRGNDLHLHFMDSEAVSLNQFTGEARHCERWPGLRHARDLLPKLKVRRRQASAVTQNRPIVVTAKPANRK